MRRQSGTPGFDPCAKNSTAGAEPNTRPVRSEWKSQWMKTNDLVLIQQNTVPVSRIQVLFLRTTGILTDRTDIAMVYIPLENLCNLLITVLISFLRKGFILFYIERL